MSKCKVFTVCTICLALLLTIALTANAIVMPNPETGELKITKPHLNKVHKSPTRDDEDPFWTYRYMVSTDGGANWSDLLNTGDTGMWEIDGDDTVSVYSGTFENFGVVACAENNLHYVAVLNGFTDYNPLERSNGVYDIMVDIEGNVTYNLIAPEGEDQGFIWSDAGIDGDGNLYAIWWNPVIPEEGDTYGELYASKSTDGGANWSDAVLVSNELDAADAYPHMTAEVGEYFYVLHQMAGDSTYLQYVLKVPASLEGESINMEMGAEVGSGTDVSYYIGTVSPITQDVASGWIYVVNRNWDLSGAVVTSSNDAGENWTTITIPGAQRYPTMVLDTEGDMPYVFSNVGVPDTTFHYSWVSFDEGGFGGGSWTERIEYMRVDYPGEMLYVAGGAVTSEGGLIGGCSIWAYPDPYITPIGYGVSMYDVDNDTWSDMNRLWDIWGEDTGLQGGYIAHPHLLAGNNNYVWMATAGRYGYTDIVYPEIATTGLSSYMLGEDKVVTVEARDNVDIYYYEDDELWDVWIDYYKVSDDTLPNGKPAWVFMEYVSYDSIDVDENGIGTYYFSLPDSMDFMINDTTAEKRILTAGDVINFYSYCWDGTGNLTIEHNGTWENVWTVNEGWTEVTENANVPFTFEVGQNYPNPFNSSTVIPFTLNRGADVKVSVFDLSGRLVDTILESNISAGQHTVSWQGENVSTGVYIYTVEAAGVRHVGKMTLLR